MIGCWLTAQPASRLTASSAKNSATHCLMRTLETTDLTKTYRGRKVVDNVSLKVKQGEVVGLLGPNGAGKTTSFYMIVGLISPDSGSVTLSNGKEEKDITTMAMYQRA